MSDFVLTTVGALAVGAGGPLQLWADIVRDFSNLGEPEALAAFFQVLMIDLVLAGDNAIVVGALAAGLPSEQRRKVILIGVLAALVLRVVFALAVILYVASTMIYEGWMGGEHVLGLRQVLGLS